MVEMTKKGKKQVVIPYNREMTQIFRNNRIKCNFSTSEIEVESFSEPLDRVYQIFNDIAYRLGETDAKEISKRMEKTGTR